MTRTNVEVVTGREWMDERKIRICEEGVEASLSLCQGEDCDECDVVLGPCKHLDHSLPDIEIFRRD